MAGKPGSGKKAEPAKKKPAVVYKPPTGGSSNSQQNNATKAPDNTQQGANSQQNNASKAPALALPPVMGMAGAPKLPVMGLPPLPSFTMPGTGRVLARPAQAGKSQSGADLPSGIFPGGAPKVQTPFDRNSYNPRGPVTPQLSGSMSHPNTPKTQATQATRPFTPSGLDTFPYENNTGLTNAVLAQSQSRYGGNNYNPRGPFASQPGRDPKFNPKPAQGTGQPVLEVTSDGIQLTKADFAYAARYSGLAIAEAIKTGDRKYLPNRMHWRTAANLPIPDGFASTEEFLTALGYAVDADGNWTKMVPTVNNGYGGGNYGTQTGSGYSDYGGYGGYGDYGGGYARGGYASNGTGLIMWRIG